MGKPSTSTDPKYWERQLRKYGLGIYQPMTDNSEGELEEPSTSITHPRGKSEDHMRLRTKIDGSEGFMDSHQITKVFKRERTIPEWALSNVEVGRLLLTAFPKMHVDSGVGKSQRRRAGQWARLIYLYYRMKQPKQIVAKELKINIVLLTRWIQKISFVAQGLTIDGKVRKKPRHLPNTPMRDLERKDEHIKSPLLPTAGTGSVGEGGTTGERLFVPQKDGLQ